jgi:hypothetical protein
MDEFNNKVLAEGYQIFRTLPRNLNPEDAYYFRHEYNKPIPDCKVSVFHQAYYTEDGVIYTNNLRLVEQSVVDVEWIDKFRLRYALSNYVKKKKYTIDDDNYYLSVVDLWSSGYAHWILDALPRLYASRELHKDCYLILPKSHDRKYIHETLKMFQFKGIRFFPEKMYAKIKNLILITHAAPQGSLHEYLSRGLRQYAWDYVENIGLKDFNCGEKVYISRSKAPKRHILNENEVQQKVTELGFKVIHFEDYNIFEQIAIMKNAKYVATLHGAGVSNMIFMPPQTHYLEIRRKGDTHNNHFFALASAMQIHYWYQLADFKPSPKADGKNFDLLMGNYYDVTLDITELENILSRMLSHTAK